ncbi:mucin-17-like [Leptodactylus fuscus]|uniref:mucin-17-like n=1 Tax=Leptodactylus fuscus TaxID=238119 RepID=UPI003F4E60B2
MSLGLTSTMIRFLVLVSVIKGMAATTTAPPKTTTPLKCENGGVSNGVKCTCPEFTDGTRCQNIKDRITIGPNYNATLELVLTANYSYTSELQNPNSAAYQEFSVKYNTMMTSLLQGFNTYYAIKKLRNNNQQTVVDTEVFLGLQYNTTVAVLDQYEETYREIVSALNIRCPPDNLCISATTGAVIPPSKEGRCSEIITPEFLQFFRPVVDKDGLVCVSRCDPGIGTKNFLDCNQGNCQIKGNKGPQCFCPYTDQYIYTYPRCRGKILIVAMYGSVGAAVGVLLIVNVVLGVFLYKKKFHK